MYARNAESQRQVSRMDKKLYDWLFSNIEEIIDMAGEQE